MTGAVASSMRTFLLEPLPNSTSAGPSEKKRAMSAPRSRKRAARRILFRQRRDLLEQPRARLVVEIFRRQPLRSRRQAGHDVARKWRSDLGRFVAKRGMGLRGHDQLQSSRVIQKPQAAELPARRRIEEVAIARTC